MDSTTAKSHALTPSRPHFARGGTEKTTMGDHNAEVTRIAARVQEFYSRKEKFRINHGSTNSTRKGALARDPNKVVDTSRLNHVVSVDTEKRVAFVEPNVPMDRLVEETLKYGLIPPVVMEFPGITAGGGYNGTSGESSSFKHGFFDRILRSVEMVLANGEIITASESEHEDLFRGAAGAVGTLGVTTMVEIELIKATSFVETTYHPVSSMEQAIEKLQYFTARPHEYDYIDGIMFYKDCGAIITGRMTDTPTQGLPIQRFSRAKDPWFFLHVSDKVSGTKLSISEAIPLPDYLFRYDRGGFWVGCGPFNYFCVPFNRITRWFLDDFLHTRMLYQALHSRGQSEQMIVQDLALPYDRASDFVDRMDDLLGIWPLWLCPLKQSPGPTMHPHVEEYEADSQMRKEMLNIGLWGGAPKTIDAFVAANRTIETTVQELGGMKWHYAQVFAPASEFWNDFEREWYDELRKKYHAEHLPNVYEKVSLDMEAEKKARKNATLAKRLQDARPLNGLLAVWSAIRSRDWEHDRNATWKDWIPRT